MKMLSSLLVFSMLVGLTGIGRSQLAANSTKQPESVTVNAPVPIAPTTPYNKPIFNYPMGIKGRLAYTADTAIYGPGGLQWPWSLYFVIRQFGNQDKYKQVKAGLNLLASYQLHAPHHQFVIQPRLSPNGKYLAIKTGKFGDPNDTFFLHIFDFQTRKLEKVTAPKYSIGYWPMFWSPNSQYIAYFREGILPPGNELPMELWIYNLQNHQQTFVVRHDELFHNVAWTPDNRLIYSLIPEPEAARKGVLAPLFSFAPDTNTKAKVLLLDAILPTPSPDGHWIAAFSQGKAGDPKLHALHKQRLLRLFSADNGEMITVNSHAAYNFSHLSGLMIAGICIEQQKISPTILTKTSSFVYMFSIMTWHPNRKKKLPR